MQQNYLFKVMAIAVIFLFSGNLGFGQLAAWELSPAPGNQASSNATTVGLNIGTATLSRGAGLTATAAGACINSNGWFNTANTATTIATAVTNNEYYEFSLPINSGFVANITQISFLLRSSGTGPNTATLRSSKDAFSTDLGTVTIPSNTSSSTLFNLPVSLSNASGTLIFRLYGYGSSSNGSNNPATTGTMRIGSSTVLLDNDLIISGTTQASGPTLSIADASILEGNAGTSSLTFTATLSQPAPVGGITFDIVTADLLPTASALAGSDYLANSQSLSIAENATTANFIVTINGDLASEGDETFNVNISNISTGATIADGLAVGTITNDDAIPITISINDISINEGNSGTSNATFTVSLSANAPAGGVAFDIATADGTASQPSDYTINSLVSQTIPAGSSTYSFTVAVNGDATGEPNETFFVNLTNIVGATAGDVQGLGTITNDDVVITKIHAIQGSGTSAALLGTQTIEAIVVGDYQNEAGNTRLGGFFVQEEDADADANPATSEGIFVYEGGGLQLKDVAIGDKVSVTGIVSEFFNLTEITVTLGSDINILSSGNTTPTAATLSFPSTPIQRETMEGMLVTLPATMTITNNFSPYIEPVPNNTRGEIEIASNGKQFNFTEINLPSASGLLTYITDQESRKIILDDDRGNTTTFLSYHLAANSINKLRSGSTVEGLTGVLDFAFNTYRLRPLAPVAFTNSNPRGPAPVLTGKIKVATVNLLNFFNGDGEGGGFPTARGAANQTALNLQKAKSVAALKLLNADIIGFEELEKDGYGPLSAIQELTNALNDATAPDTYQIIDHGSLLGTDVITVGIIYKPAVVTPFGISLSTSSLPSTSRPPMAQTFTANNSCEKFTVVVNHFKSKGGTGTGANADINDGQGNWNALRVQSSTALNTWINDIVIPAAGNTDVLILGDLNAYKKEDPIKYLEMTGGYTNLVSGTSYAFDGFFGSLDHVMGSSTLTPQYVDGGKWQNNSDEVAQMFHYDGTVPESNEFATSDHNPTVASFTKVIDATDITNVTTTKVKQLDNFLLDADCKIIAKVVPGTVAGNIDGEVVVGTTNITDGTAIYGPRKYTITPTVTNGSALVTLYFTQADFDTYNTDLNKKNLPIDAADVLVNKQNLKIYKKSGTTTEVIDPVDTDINFVGNHWVVSFNVPSFSEFFLGSDVETTLPVTLISFTGKKENNTNILTWKTANEKAFDGFEVQKSADGKKFTKIGFVKGNKNELYQFIDYQTSSPIGGGYYRLKMIDLDGSSALSKIIAIQSENEVKTLVGKVYPNPAIDKTAFVEIKTAQAGVWKMSTFNAQGSLQNSYEIQLSKGLNKVSVELNNLSQGIYFLNLENANGEKFVRKVLKN